jgi:hypothetical protein
VPLSKCAFNEFKSNLKGLEMAASGNPFVASPTESYIELHAHGAGELARKPKDWHRALDRLRDPEERALAGKRARQVVEDHYDIANNWVRWRDCYEELVT